MFFYEAPGRIDLLLLRLLLEILRKTEFAARAKCRSFDCASCDQAARGAAQDDTYIKISRLCLPNMSIRPGKLLPLQEDELGTEGWAHRCEDAVGAGFARGVHEDIFEDGEDRGGGEITDLAEAAPGGLEGVVREVERVLHGFENLGAAGVKDVAGDVVDGEAVVGEEGLDVAAEVFVDDLGDVGREVDLEAHVADVPAHDVLGVAIEGGAGVEDPGAGDAGGAGALGEGGFGACDDDGGGAVAEEAAGDEVGDGLVVVLPGEGAEFDGEEQSVLVGEGADVVRGAGDAGGSGDAAKAEDGSALHAGGEGHEVDEAGVDGRAGDAGDRGEEDGGDVRRGEPNPIEGGGDGFFAELDGGYDPGVVGGTEAGEILVDAEGEDEIAKFDTAVDEETVDKPGLFHSVLPARRECFRDCCLGVAVRWISRAD